MSVDWGKYQSRPNAMPMWETKIPDDPILPKGSWRITFSGIKEAEVVHDAVLRVVDGTLFIDTPKQVVIHATGRWLSVVMDKQ
jgi:hypothetical protein